MISNGRLDLNASEMDFDIPTRHAQLIHNHAFSLGCAQGNAKSVLTRTDAAARRAAMIFIRCCWI